MTKKKRSEASKKANKQKASSQGMMGDISKITAEKMRELIEEARKERLEREKDRYAKPECEEGKCVVCKGKVIEEYVSVSDRPFTKIPLGPASRNCYSWQYDGCHCTKCGLKYEFIPLCKIR